MCCHCYHTSFRILACTMIEDSLHSFTIKRFVWFLTGRPDSWMLFICVFLFSFSFVCRGMIFFLLFTKQTEWAKNIVVSFFCLDEHSNCRGRVLATPNSNMYVQIDNNCLFVGGYLAVLLLFVFILWIMTWHMFLWTFILWIAWFWIQKKSYFYIYNFRNKNERTNGQTNGWVSNANPLFMLVFLSKRLETVNFSIFFILSMHKYFTIGTEWARAFTWPWLFLWWIFVSAFGLSLHFFCHLLLVRR